MKVSVARLDMKKTQAGWPADIPFAPALIKPVAAVGGSNWHILDAAYTPGDQPVWAFSAHDEYLRIPLFSYDLNPAADLAFAFLLQVGLSCAAYLPRPVCHFYVATGNPVELLYDPDTGLNNGLRYWFGFAVKTF
jgi:hypothetical protein